MSELTPLEREQLQSDALATQVREKAAKLLSLVDVGSATGFVALSANKLVRIRMLIVDCPMQTNGADPLVGATIAKVEDDGSVLVDLPGGARRRYHKLLRTDVQAYEE